MGLNRCTALAFPFIHNKIWQDTPLITIIVIFIVAPLGIGYKYLFGPCLGNFWKAECAAFVAECYFFITVFNTPLLTITLVIIIMAILLSRTHTTSLSDFRKVERRLVWQTITSSTFLIFYYVLHYVGGVIFDENPELAIQIYTMCTVFYSAHTYLPIVILFIVSPTFRQRFIGFYKCQHITATSTRSASMVVSFQDKRSTRKVSSVNNAVEIKRHS